MAQATHTSPRVAGFVLLLVACLLLSGCEFALRLVLTPAFQKLEADLRDQKRAKAALNEHRKRLVSFGAVAPTEVDGKRFAGGELKLWITYGWQGDTRNWIIVNFGQAGEALSYKALVRADCENKVLWLESWQTFTSAEGLGAIVDSGRPPSPHRLPDHEPYSKIAQKICEEGT